MRHDVTFWGVRGSIPSPGAQTALVGGNTTSVEVRMATETLLIDGGSGLRAYATSRTGGPLRATLLFSHYHWDHIQGVPFFLPLFHPESKVVMVGPPGLRAVLSRQMSSPTFPVGLEALQARLTFQEISAGDAFDVGSVRVQTTALNHPGGAVAYRLEHQGHVVVTGFDHEHGDPEADERLVSLAAGAELLLYDAMYHPEEYKSRRGWGHSTFEQGVILAHRAGVRHLALTHHDPTRTDEAVADLEHEAQALFPGAFAAREGETIALSASRPVAEASSPGGSRLASAETPR